jgi:hypothetical protein
MGMGRFPYGAAFSEDPIVQSFETRVDPATTGDHLFRPVEYSRRRVRSQWAGGWW